MRRIGIVLLFFLGQSAGATTNDTCTNWPSWSKAACQRLHQIWTEGDNELYLSGYAWHNRYTYSREKIKKYNELAIVALPHY
jgi:palmitoyl transferase